MESPWQFPTDARLDALCCEVASELVAQFGISKAEAIGRINREWKDRNWLASEWGVLVYHETADEWTRHIYYGKETAWWVEEEHRAGLGLGPVVPKPYP
jgi:hypothetical protein